MFKHFNSRNCTAATWFDPCPLRPPHYSLALSLTNQVLNNIVEQQVDFKAQLQRLSAPSLAAAGEQLEGSSSSSSNAAIDKPQPMELPHLQEQQQQQEQQGNYCCRLLAAATHEQWQQVANMTPHVSTELNSCCAACGLTHVDWDIC
jgi:hypothetical protein